MNNHSNNIKILREQLKHLLQSKDALKGRAKSAMGHAIINLRTAIGAIMAVDKMNKAKVNI